jgi:hypothetical protein
MAARQRGGENGVAASRQKITMAAKHLAAAARKSSGVLAKNALARHQRVAARFCRVVAPA